MKVKLMIVAAACLGYDKKIYALPWGNRHHNIIQYFNTNFEEQGFILSNGRFVMRKAAKILAISNGQYLTDEQYQIRHNHTRDYYGPDLFSEDLF